MSPGNATSPPAFSEDPVGATGNAARAGLDVANDTVNGAVNGLAVAAQMAADGIATAIEASGQALGELLPFAVDAAVVLA